MTKNRDWKKEGERVEQFSHERIEAIKRACRESSAKYGKPRYSEIARHFGVTRQHVWQIYNEK